MIVRCVQFNKKEHSFDRITFQNRHYKNKAAQAAPIESPHEAELSLLSAIPTTDLLNITWLQGIPNCALNQAASNPRADAVFENRPAWSFLECPHETLFSLQMIRG